MSVQLLKKGEIDVVDGMAPIQWERELAHTRSAARLRKIVYTYPAYSYLGFNLRLPLFSDVRVRHAIDLLIPRGEILAQIYLNQYAATCSGFDPPSSPNYNHDVAPRRKTGISPCSCSARRAGRTIPATACSTGTAGRFPSLS